MFGQASLSPPRALAWFNVLSLRSVDHLCWAGTHTAHLRGMFDFGSCAGGCLGLQSLPSPRPAIAQGSAGLRVTVQGRQLLRGSWEGYGVAREAPGGLLSFCGPRAEGW